MSRNQLSLEVIEAAAKAMRFEDYRSRYPDSDWDAEKLWTWPVSDLAFVNAHWRSLARAALTAAGVAAVERDSNFVAEAVPDLGNTITGGADSQLTGDG